MKEYIDKAAFLEKMKGTSRYFSVKFDIEEFPAADVVEVKRGRWEEKEFAFGDVYYDCSVCGESFCLIDGTPTDHLYNFCPNCGAKMDQEG